MATSNITIPDLGGAENVEVIEICVAIGDQVNEGDSIIVVETDKASMEIPTSSSGVITSISLKEGDTCNTGDVMAEVEVENAGEVVAPEPVVEAVAEPVIEAAPVATAAEVEAEAVATLEAQERTALVPDLGGAVDVEVIELSVKVGDEVAEGDTLIVVETDKASMEIPAPFGGKVLEVKVKEGAKVNTGDVMALLAAEVEVGSAVVVMAAKPVEDLAPVTASVVEALQAKLAPAQVVVVGADNEVALGASVHAGPAVRMLARDLGVELAQVTASGPRSRVLKEDVQTFVKQRLQRPAATPMQGSGIERPPAIDFSQFGATDSIKMSKIKRITATNMTRNWLNVPHVTQFDHADITELEVFRKGLKAEAEQRGTKVTPLPFMLKACALALRQFPQFNVSLDNDGEHIIQKHYVNIGVAVDTPAGLMVPVLRDVDTKSIWQLSAEVIEMGAKAKAKKLMPADMQGGCFTISSLGSIGGTAFTPIVNAPEVAILGVSKAEMQPRWDGSQFEPRLMMPLSLSYDHRAVNGADAARFTQYLAKLLGDIRHLVM
jgi:pyruvate dehydrogenase E2 component (dihydrolipoamide acetyltransferase)